MGQAVWVLRIGYALECGSEAVIASAADKLPMFISCKFASVSCMFGKSEMSHVEVKLQQLHVSTSQESNLHCACVS